MSDMMKTRRKFLKQSAGAAGVLGLASVCGGCAWFHRNDVQVEAPLEARYVRVDFAAHPTLREPNGFVRLKARGGDLRLIAVRTASGPVVALSMVCTHWSCDVDWSRDGQELECPCHGSRFDVAGKVLEGPADEPLAAFPVTEDEHGVEIGLDPIPS